MVYKILNSCLSRLRITKRSKSLEKTSHVASCLLCCRHKSRVPQTGKSANCDSKAQLKFSKGPGFVPQNVKEPPRTVQVHVLMLRLLRCTGWDGIRLEAIASSLGRSCRAGAEAALHLLDRSLRQVTQGLGWGEAGPRHPSRKALCTNQ